MTRHGFRSATAVVAYCGAVERPTTPRIVPASAGMVPADACEECVRTYARLTSAPIIQIQEVVR
jgi:hypothetical protein